MEHEINNIVDTCFDASFKAGWWHDKEGFDLRTNPMCFSQHLMLIVSELSEALEGDRTDAMDSHLPHRDAREVELADACTRLFVLAGAYNMDLGGAIVEKLIFNANRPDHKLENRAKADGKKY